MDSYGDHALVCQCKGDRTKRHNALRNTVYADALLGNMGAEREKAGLLPARPREDDIICTGSSPETQARSSSRRPADVYLPRGVHGRPVALDFACTSSLQSARLLDSVHNPSAVLTSYEQFKRDFKPHREDDATEVQCTRQGLCFIPMVIESHSGGWGKEARQVLDAIAKHISASGNAQEEEAASLRIAQRLSITLLRENARTILRGLGELAFNDVLSDGNVSTGGVELWQ